MSFSESIELIGGFRKDWTIACCSNTAMGM